MKKVLFFSLLLCFTSALSAQTRSAETETINGKKYYVHTVQLRETFWGLSKMYDVSIDDIQMSNDNLTALSVGKKILIPVNGTGKTEVSVQNEKQYESGEIVVVAGKSYIAHYVQPGQTIYSVSRLYQSTSERIILANPALQENQTLSINQLLLIPFEGNHTAIDNTEVRSIAHDNAYENESEISTTENPQQIFESNYVRPVLNITLLLPFYLDKQNRLAEGSNAKEPLYKESVQFLEYYEGVLLALDTLKSRGISVNLEVIESNLDSATTNIGKIKTKNDLIIGPVYQKTFPRAAEFAKRNKIPIIYPLSFENVNTTNPYVIQVTTPSKYRYKAMANNIIENNENCHVCLVYNNENEKKNLNQCKGAFNELKEKMIGKHISLEEIYFPTAGFSAIEKAFGKKEKTIVVVLSRQQAFANNIVTKLFQTSKGKNIELWGVPQWERSENLELDFLFDLHLKLVSYGEINYKSKNVNEFITVFREKYKTEPSKFSFQGYDQMLYFGTLLATNNNLLSALEAEPAYNGLVDKYNFTRKDGGAFVNTTSFIVEYNKNTFTRTISPYEGTSDK